MTFFSEALAKSEFSIQDENTLKEGKTDSFSFQKWDTGSPAEDADISILSILDHFTANLSDREKLLNFQHYTLKHLCVHRVIILQRL